jgi:hypothetical protein
LRFLLFEICFASWLFGAIAIVVACASFMVMVVWCHRYYFCTCFFHVRAHLAPSLLLLLLSLSWSPGAIVASIVACVFFVVVVT